MEGIICIDKPTEHTSFDVIARLRGITKIKRIGHAGTLDPMATGVLPIFFGRATKAVDIMPISDKRYEADFQLGFSSTTQDITGEVLQQSCQPFPSEGNIISALEKLTGEISQIPPMYSAVQIDGVRLYDLARQGIEVTRKERRVFIHTMNLLEYNPTTGTGKLDILCSKGTYVRTIIHDAGVALGNLAVLTKLRRTMSCGFTLSDCYTIDDIKNFTQDSTLCSKLIPISTAFESLEKIILAPAQTRLYLNGIKLNPEKMQCPNLSNDVCIYSDDGRFLGVSSLKEDLLHCKARFVI